MFSGREREDGADDTANGASEGLKSPGLTEDRQLVRMRMDYMEAKTSLTGFKDEAIPLGGVLSRILYDFREVLKLQTPSEKLFGIGLLWCC